MDPLTSPENEHLAGYLEVLMDHGREHSQRAVDARTVAESSMPPAADQPRAHTHLCDFYAVRYLCP